ncbi:HRDC domain-containing protein [Plasmodiophora brassicae]
MTTTTTTGTQPDEWLAFMNDALTRFGDAVGRSNRLPSGAEYLYYQTNPAFRDRLSVLQSRILRSLGKVIRLVDPSNEFPSSSSDAERFACAVEATDMALEHVDEALDKARAPKEAPDVAVSTLSAGNHARQSLRGRPQSKFADPVDNSPDRPWVPKLPNPRPNQLLGRDLACPSPQLPSCLRSHIEGLGVSTSQGTPSSANPYHLEIMGFEYLDAQLGPCAEQLFRSMEDTPLTLIDDESQLGELVEALNGVSEFAIDLEHHSFHSYLGFTCLMQISTRSADYIVDTLALRPHMHRLLDPFTNPAIVKVLHGADMDVEWLQKDFSLYLVNMFDTGQASRVLELPSFSLKYLLEVYCDVKADKAYQMADWRIRPVPPAMIKYARADTHFLLYIYDRLRNQLCNRSPDGIEDVLARSRALCLKTYAKPVCDATSHLKMLRQFDVSLSGQQANVLGALYRWRDALARDLDESCGYVLPAAAMMNIARRCPSTERALLSIYPGLSAPVRKRIQDFLRVIADARDLPTPAAEAFAERVTSTTTSTVVVAFSPATVPVDKADVPVLCLAQQQTTTTTTSSVVIAEKSASRMFDCSSSSDDDDDSDADAERRAKAILNEIQLRPPPPAVPSATPADEAAPDAETSPAAPEDDLPASPPSEPEPSVNADDDDDDDDAPLPPSLNEIRGREKRKPASAQGNAAKRRRNGGAQSDPVAFVPFDYGSAAPVHDDAPAKPAPPVFDPYGGAKPRQRNGARHRGKGRR